MPPSTAAIIPRFLLPQRGAIWLRPRAIRHASSKAQPGAKKPSKPLVLEKPAKFNPPSHAPRRFKAAPRYPGPKLSQAEETTMKTKKYPHMMPAEGTLMHWFITNKTIHLYITLTTLFTLAGTVWITNFKRNSPFSHMLPPYTDFLLHPIAYSRTFFEVVKLTGDYNTAQTMERRKARVEDVAKRHEYRKAHGLDKDESFGSWTAKSDDELLGPGIKLGDGKGGGADGGVAIEGAAQELQQQEPERVVRERRPVKKWLGIW
ncbi:uncharacterized protein BP5553_03364 [Venustampulla echinocandica]|uniref:Uncharacterized protein n=1 Tax=Venustampulla echinocandica TaxID=2656787 RepID=A0A370TU30_9HELO|nr:uncharacterized protein BP5553_03364 [Venustampulla echinocandica]RDL39024.1 hypothetical protein BP5553_03364 [Venustampulla echinocandica]